MFTVLGLKFMLVEKYNFVSSDPIVVSILTMVPILVWGTVFLVLNRRALNRLETESVGG